MEYMYRTKENPELPENEVKEYIKTSYQYFMFDSKIEYKKLVRRIQDGPLTSLAGINKSFLQKKTVEFFPRIGSSQNQQSYYSRRGISGDDALEVLAKLQEARDDAIAFSKETSAAVLLLKLSGDKLNDGKNGISIRVYADIYKLKDQDTVDKHSRHGVKSLINELFAQWVKHKMNQRCTSQFFTNVLPTKLLSELTSGDMKWNLFCEELYVVRKRK